MPPAADPSAPGRGIFVMLLAMLLFACMDAGTKYLSQTYAISQIVWVRYLFFALFAALVARRNLRLLLRSARPGLQILRSFLLVCEVAVFILAFHYMPLADVHAIAGATPLIVTALSWPLLRERVSPKQWAAVIAGMIGVLIIVRPGFVELHWPVAIAILGAVLFALYQIQLRVVARSDRPETTLLYSAFVGLLIASIAGPLEWRSPDFEGWLLLLLTGLLGACAHLAMTRALDLAPAAALQPYSYTLMLWAAVVGFLVFGQFPDIWTVLGGVIVALSGLYAWRMQMTGRG